ncbi:signal peptidase I [Candidatus Kaiserbacteria bacterium CG10_big_fil_rev_8_21_14_0_10_59_10]|uniref:Signal peptidase I n=1 Tax=Candidatus Kaiserbacteria bacterium CG10_big_fil_rev_8_21_14_0_10_59_10 TaxID=1974612 RepID=A0A2H0UA40_9BACT|nr:MAG: signal peptidase I [Candidatus Kaiserbacteria bacterium CG10_big_fil_rev_8_21_14_0_10_59_10]
MSTANDTEVRTGSDDGTLDTPESTPHSPFDARRGSERGALFTYTVAALGIALFVRFFIAAPYVVSGASMEPNFHHWDYLITDRVSYRFDEPARGDIVVFRLPHEPSRTLIKRVVGLPGETVILDARGVTIQNAEHPNGFALPEPYLSEKNRGGLVPSTVTLGEEEFFVLGDNRRVSSDSRVWGALPRENIVGRVLLRLFPFTDIELFPGSPQRNS